jgi:predicted Fe-S protein YdhL (DUF1289 family)
MSPPRRSKGEMHSAQLEARPADPPTAVPSPCINVCRMHAASGLCEGCLRTLEEIGAWASMGEALKREVWRRLEQRRALATPSPPARPGDSP